MIIAVASGKGGTGKTTLSIAFALVIKEPVQLLDCDVEEPNAHLFLDIQAKKDEIVCLPVPIIDAKKCTLCNACAQICEYNAITTLKDKVIIFEDLCHNCGGCKLICPQKAISETMKPIGTVSRGMYNNISFVQGILEVGSTMSPALIRAVKRNMKKDIINIIDCPPGNACPVVTALNGADYVILVTEATPFGLHDLKLSVDTNRRLGLKFGVIINRANTGDTRVRDFCEKEKINVLLEIPESMEVAKAYSCGGTLLDAMPEIEVSLKNIVKMIKEGTE